MICQYWVVIAIRDIAALLSHGCMPFFWVRYMYVVCEEGHLIHPLLCKLLLIFYMLSVTSQSFLRQVVLRVTCGKDQGTSRDCLRSEVKVQCCSAAVLHFYFCFLRGRAVVCRCYASWQLHDPSVKRIGFPRIAMAAKQAIRMASHFFSPVGLPNSSSFNPCTCTHSSSCPPISSHFSAAGVVHPAGVVKV